jgi:hypothetical protein
MAGTRDPDHISTSFADRQNLKMRMGMRRFTLTSGFSKKVENHGHAGAMHFNALQLLSDSSYTARYTCNGSWLD